jgi:two-component system sensor histidine kinase/response regulator
LLIVDDQPSNIRVLAGLLAPYGFELSFASSGAQALEHLRQSSCDLVLMDIMMPDMSGIEVCRQMQSEPAQSRIPVIFITSMHDQATLIAAFGAGGVDYLTKPFIVEELLARIEIHLRLRSSEQRLHKLLALRELMMSTLSHDLRGPIGTMASMLDLMLKNPLQPERSEKMLQHLGATARRSYELLEDLLTWSQAVTDELPFHPIRLPLQSLAQECLDFHQAAAEAKQLTLGLALPAQSQILADPNLVRTVLINLLGNAIKFTPAGGRVLLRSTARPAAIALEVIDSGIGIPESLGEQLARNHAITSRSGTEGEKGTGMGLKICQEFAARHGGHLEIRPLEQGSCFALVLPQAEAEV